MSFAEGSPEEANATQLEREEGARYSGNRSARKRVVSSRICNNACHVP